MAVNLWWYDDPAEIYFLETTDRPDFGVDLKAPQADDAGHAHHAYALVRFVRHGDVIFHYMTPDDAIIAWSRAVGAPFEDEMVWGARGSSAQRAGVRPYRRPGWRVSLEGPFMLDAPVTQGELRSHEPAIRDAILAAESDADGTLYGPFNSRSTCRCAPLSTTSPRFRSASSWQCLGC